jgi:hypothetical protein
MSLSDGVARSGWTNLYRRTVGGIQVLYASIFGCGAFGCLWWSAQEMVWIAQKGFTFQGITFKGTYIPPFHLGNFARGMEFALLFLSSLIGGYGLLRLRPWARRWEIAYLVVVLVFSLRDLATEVRRGHDFGYIVLFSLALTLPYLPLLLTSPPPHKPPLFGKANGAKPFVGDLAGI